jgi:hypothetical protein
MPQHQDILNKTREDVKESSISISSIVSEILNFSSRILLFRSIIAQDLSYFPWQRRGYCVTLLPGFANIAQEYI